MSGEINSESAENRTNDSLAAYLTDQTLYRLQQAGSKFYLVTTDVSFILLSSGFDAV
jgi:hypothetical protein